tara:strand:- start:593 stop:865 length:273 start_codon:yes stop_codon:yes gene_type:complete
MGLGVVIANNKLIPDTHNPPAALLMQINVMEVKADDINVRPDFLSKREMQLPHAIDIDNADTAFQGSVAEAQQINRTSGQFKRQIPKIQI